MRTEGQIRHKLQQVTFRHLQRTVRTALSCRPENCTYNGVVKLPTGDVRICTLLTDKDGAHPPCDESFGGLKQAANCPKFLCRNTKEDVREGFTEFLRNSDVATIASRYPDIAALLWTLDATTPVIPQEDPDPAPVEPQVPPVSLLYFQPEGGATSYTLQTYLGGYRTLVYPTPVRDV